MSVTKSHRKRFITLVLCGALIGYLSIMVADLFFYRGPGLYNEQTIYTSIGELFDVRDP